MGTDHTFDSKLVRTRKEHRCFGCNHKYPKHTRLYTQAVAYEGKMYQNYWCIPCWEFIHQPHISNDDLEHFSPGDIWEYDTYKEFREKRIYTIQPLI